MKETSQGKYIYIYIVRIIAAFLVSWGHFVTVGCYNENSIYGVISNIPNGILLPVSTHSLWKLEGFFYARFQLEFGIVGVALFFLVSGYLIPHLQEKYNPPERMPMLLFRRMERIYPVTFICVIMVGLTVYISSAIRYPLRNYVESVLVSGTFTGTEMTMGVMWYLQVLMFLYVICTLVPKIDIKNLTYVYGILFLLVLIPAALKDYPQCWIFSNIEWVARYCGIPLLGSAAYLLKDERSVCRKIVDFAWFFLLTLMLLRLDSVLYGTQHTYTNWQTYIAAFIIIAASVLLSKLVGKSAKLVKMLSTADKYLFHFYLVHVAIGFTAIYWLRMIDVNPYICVAAAYAVSVAAAVIAFYLTALLRRFVNAIYSNLMKKTKDVFRGEQVC